LRADLQLVDLRQASLDILGPGRYVLQRYGNRMHGVLSAGTLIDHPGAEVYLISAGGTNRGEPPLLDSDDIYWLWCKRGHVEVYGAFPAGFTRGRADIRIDTPSPKGAHIIAYSRSEGTKRGRGSKLDPKAAERSHEAGGAGKARSQLLYVPPSDLPVDIALKANLLGGHEPETSLVEYHAAGTLWLLGNNVQPSAYLVKTEPDLAARRTFLVNGDAPKATVIAVGNTLANDRVLTRINARTKIARATLVRRHWWYRGKPERAKVAANAFLPTLGPGKDKLPPVPRSNPPILGCIPVGVKPPKALDLVSVKTFGAAGDGKTDDTAALQAALGSDKVTRLFFPPGVYITSKPLDLRIHERFGAGGWIAGAGPDKSVIRNVAGGRAVDANGLYWTLIQGLGFETADQSDVCFHLDKRTGHTSGVLFHNCRFRGGKVAMGIAMDKGPNCEHIMHTGCVFEDADIGFAMGNPNALKNLVAESTFRNCRVNMALRWLRDGKLTETGVHGCFGVIGATFSGTREKDFDFALHKRRYFLGIVSDSPMICDSRAGSKFMDVQIYENCEWYQTAPVFYRTGTSGGAIFLYSRVKTGGIEVTPGRHGVAFAIDLWSRLGGEPWHAPVRLFGEKPK
jgi:hypothetical protein